MFRKILVPLDGSPLAEQALVHAGTVAARASGSLDLLLVDTDAQRANATDGPQGNPEQRTYISSMTEEAGRLLNVPVTGTVIGGDPATTIVAHARATFTDLIVMTTHGRTGLSRALLGSVADSVVRGAGIPVLIQRPVANRDWRAASARPFQRVLVPLDGTDDAMAVILPVLDLCRWMGARPILARAVHPVVTMMFSEAGVPTHGVVDDDATRHLVQRAQDALTALAIDIEADSRIIAETSVEVGNDIAATLVGIARQHQADLIAMSTHSRGASRVLVSSMTDRILRATELPLLLQHIPLPLTAVSVAPAAAYDGETP